MVGNDRRPEEDGCCATGLALVALTPTAESMATERTVGRVKERRSSVRNTFVYDVSQLRSCKKRTRSKIKDWYDARVRGVYTRYSRSSG